MTRDALSSNYPPPDADGAAQVEAVAAAIRERIDAARGWIDFAHYMALALYAPGLGYYSAGATKFGRDGDFVTAPEISTLFAEVLAAQIGSLLSACAAAAPEVLELGPGTGSFAGLALRELAKRGSLPVAYNLLEVGADLRARQPARVSELAGLAADRARWLDTLPVNFTGVVFANEVLDALPCERFVVRDGSLQRLGVSIGAEGRFGWHARLPDGQCEGDEAFVAELASRLPSPLRARLPEGYTGEFQPAIAPWIGALGALLRRGAVLLVDYGLPRRHYYHPQRSAGTLRCHYRHRAHDDPFVYPGLTDLSAWVDFTAVAEAALEADLEVSGFSTQAAVLLAGGIEARLAAALEACGDDAIARARLSQGAARLLLPGEMGESVKVMLLSRGIEAPAGAFALQDLRDSL